MEVFKKLEFNLMSIEANVKMKVADADIYFAGALNSSIDSGCDNATYDIEHGLRKVSINVS